MTAVALGIIIAAVLTIWYETLPHRARCPHCAQQRTIRLRYSDAGKWTETVCTTCDRTIERTYW